MNPKRIIVLSDIHMSDGNNKHSWFHDSNADQFEGILNDLAQRSDVDEIPLLGDVFDLWLYPIWEKPWDFAQVCKQWENKTLSALKNCLRAKKTVFYMNGNHDMQVTREQVESISVGNNHVIWTFPEQYAKTHNKALHCEHGHCVDAFNAPADPDDNLNGMPLGYYITRLAATAADPGKHKLKVHGLLQEFRMNHTEKSDAGKILVELIIEGLKDDIRIHGEFVTDKTVISFADESKNVTIGQVKSKYHSLLETWQKKWPENWFDCLEVCVVRDGLGWYAKHLQRTGQAIDVIMGHTHHGLAEGTYINDGCWCRETKDKTPHYSQIDISSSGDVDVSLWRWNAAQNASEAII